MTLATSPTRRLQIARSDSASASIRAMSRSISTFAANCLCAEKGTRRHYQTEHPSRRQANPTHEPTYGPDWIPPVTGALDTRSHPRFRVHASEEQLGFDVKLGHARIDRVRPEMSERDAKIRSGNADDADGAIVGGGTRPRFDGDLKVHEAAAHVIDRGFRPHLRSERKTLLRGA